MPVPAVRRFPPSSAGTSGLENWSRLGRVLVEFHHAKCSSRSNDPVSTGCPLKVLSWARTVTGTTTISRRVYASPRVPQCLHDPRSTPCAAWAAASGVAFGRSTRGQQPSARSHGGGCGGAIRWMTAGPVRWTSSLSPGFWRGCSPCGGIATGGFWRRGMGGGIGGGAWACTMPPLATKIPKAKTILIVAQPFYFGFPCCGNLLV
jgi:hypothetical protein